MTIGLIITLCILSLFLGILIGVFIGISTICLATIAGRADKAMGVK